MTEHQLKRPEDPPTRNRAPEPWDRRTWGKARRNSNPAGDERWTRMTWSERRRHERALRTYVKGTVTPGLKQGAVNDDGKTIVLGPGHVQVYEKLLDFACAPSGAIEPSLKWLARELGHTVRTIHRWLKGLRDHGFLFWVRRFREIDGARHSRGPQVEQETNAYWLQIPAKALARLGRFAAPPPLPDDEAARKAEMVAQLRAMALRDQEEAIPAIKRAQARLQEIYQPGPIGDERDVP